VSKQTANPAAGKGRLATITRKTKETSIDLTIDLDGSGQVKVGTGIGFFDHMLTLLCRHALFDVDVAATGDASLRIIDVSDPTKPSIVGGVKDDTNLSGINSVFVSGRYAYVVTQNDDSLRIIDVSDPMAPFSVGTHATEGDALDIALSGYYAMVADGQKGISIFDVSDPYEPVFIASHASSGVAASVVVQGEYIFLTDSKNLSVCGDPRRRSSFATEEVTYTSAPLS